MECEMCNKTNPNMCHEICLVNQLKRLTDLIEKGIVVYTQEKV